MTPEQKSARIERAKQHVEMDRLITGVFIEWGDSDEPLRGCSVGCDAIDIQTARGVSVEDLKSYNCHAIVAREDGTPVWLEYLRDDVYEGLPASDRDWWHVELAESLPDDTRTYEDWQPYFHAVCIEILLVALQNRDTWEEPYGQQVADAIELTLAYHRSPTEAGRVNAESAAWSAARSTVGSPWSAAWSAARAAARSATRSDSYDEDAAVSAAASTSWAVESAARSAASGTWKQIADAVIRVMSTPRS